MELQNGNSDVMFNSFEGLEEVPYKILQWLVTNQSDEANWLWKCLKYNGKDCLSQPDVEIEEGMNLIWSGESEQSDYRIFTTPLASNSLGTSADMTQLRIYELGKIPVSQYDSIVLYEIDIYSNDKTNGIIKPNKSLVERTCFVENSCILQLLNGKDLGIGYGYLRFDAKLNSSVKSMLNINNGTDFYGRSLLMGLRYNNSNIGGGCA